MYPEPILNFQKPRNPQQWILDLENLLPEIGNGNGNNGQNVGPEEGPAGPPNTPNPNNGGGNTPNPNNGGGNIPNQENGGNTPIPENW